MPDKPATQMRPSETIERDSKVPNLHLRHRATRSSWHLFYRTKAGEQRRPKLGDASVLNRTQAREIAMEWLVRIARGEDPAAQKDRHTVQQLFDRYVEQYVNVDSQEAKSRRIRKVKASTWKHCYEPIWKRHILPKLGKVDVTEVTMAHANDIHHKLRDTPYQANRAMAVLHKAMHLAERWGWRPLHSNPVVVDRYTEVKRKRFPSKDEAIRLFQALDAMREDQPWFVGLVELLALTGCRRNEIMTARREWIRDGNLHLPDSKGGERVIPLNSHALQVIAELPIEKDNPYLIVGRRAGQHLKEPKGLWSELLKKAKIEGLRMHDLRRYFASVGLSGGLTLETVGQLLGHQQAQTTKRYAFLLTSEAKIATELAGQQVQEARKPKKKARAVKRPGPRRGKKKAS